MKRVLWLAVATGAVVAAASVALAAPTRQQNIIAANCGATNVTFFFWPHGHNKISSLKFPKYPYPHMEVYKTSGNSYPDSNELALVALTPSGGTSGGFAKSCKKRVAKSVNPSPAKTKTTAAKMLKCKFPKAPDFSFAKVQKSIDFTATMPGSKNVPLELEAFIAKTGSSLRYDPKRCKASSPPH